MFEWNEKQQNESSPIRRRGDQCRRSTGRWTRATRPDRKPSDSADDPIRCGRFCCWYPCPGCRIYSGASARNGSHIQPGWPHRIRPVRLSPGRCCSHPLSLFPASRQIKLHYDIHSYIVTAAGCKSPLHKHPQFNDDIELKEKPLKSLQFIRIEIHWLWTTLSFPGSKWEMSYHDYSWNAHLGQRKPKFHLCPFSVEVINRSQRRAFGQQRVQKESIAEINSKIKNN